MVINIIILTTMMKIIALWMIYLKEQKFYWYFLYADDGKSFKMGTFSFAVTLTVDLTLKRPSATCVIIELGKNRQCITVDCLFYFPNHAISWRALNCNQVTKLKCWRQEHVVTCEMNRIWTCIWESCSISDYPIARNSSCYMASETI